MMNWWLDKGLDGFRVDAIINIKKPQPLVSYPADRADGLCDLGVVLDHAEGIGEFLEEMRDCTFKPHDSFSVGEVFNMKDSMLKPFMGENGYFSSIFDFRRWSWEKPSRDGTTVRFRSRKITRNAALPVRKRRRAWASIPIL